MLKKLQKKDDPEFLKQVLAMTSEEIQNIDNETAIRIALLKVPDGWRLCLTQSKQLITTHNLNGSDIQDGKIISKYILVKNGEDAFNKISTQKPINIIDLQDKDFSSYFKD